MAQRKPLCCTGVASAVASLTVLAVGCSPTAPSPVGLTIGVSRTMLIVQETATLSATLRLSNGQNTTVVPTWSIDDGKVGSVNDAGTLTATAPGTGTITAKYQGFTATQPVRVVPDYRGNWTGSARVSACSCSSACIPCGCRFALGASLPVVLTLSQTADQVSGTFGWLEPFAVGPATGIVNADNRLILTAPVLIRPTFSASYALTEWRSTIDVAAGTMVGNFTVVTGVDPVAPGQCIVTNQNDLQVLKRTSQ